MCSSSVFILFRGVACTECLVERKNSISLFYLNTSKKIEKRYIKYEYKIYNRIVMLKSRRNNRLVKIIKNVLVGQVLYTIYPYVVVSLIFFYAHPFSIGILTSDRSRKTSRSKIKYCFSLVCIGFY